MRPFVLHSVGGITVSTAHLSLCIISNNLCLRRIALPRQLTLLLDRIRPGCTDVRALNYDRLATRNDGTCQLAVPGCTFTVSSNYNPAATIDDGSCWIMKCRHAHACSVDATCHSYGPGVYRCTCLPDFIGPGFPAWPVFAENGTRMEGALPPRDPESTYQSQCFVSAGVLIWSSGGARREFQRWDQWNQHRWDSVLRRLRVQDLRVHDCACGQLLARRERRRRRLRLRSGELLDLRLRHVRYPLFSSRAA